MYQQRIERVLQALGQQGLPQMLVCDPRSIWYLTGVDVEPFERLFALYLSRSGHHKLFLNRLYTVPKTGLEEIWFSDTDDYLSILASHLDGEAPLGVDKDLPARFLLPIMEHNPHMICRLSSDCVDDARACKDAREQELMRENSRINDEAMRRAAAYIRTGMTERQVAEYLLTQYRDLGCQGPSFSPIISFGPNAADPHHMPDDTALKAGDCIVLDIGGKKDRYCSDMTRTYFCGQPSGKHAAIHDLVRQANEAAEALIRPGVRLCDLDAAARNLIAEAGYGPYFTHRLGHFIGQSEHEKGDVSSANTAQAKPGMIFSIEPGVYLPGEMGVRVEDLVLVTEDGCEVLNQVDKHWQAIG